MRRHFKMASERDKDIQFNALFSEKHKLIQEDTKTKQRCDFGLFPECIWRYKREEDLTTKLQEVEKLMENVEKHENVDLAHHLLDFEYPSSQDHIPFKSRKSKFKDLLNALKDDSNYITGLNGKGGTGKTTLAKEVGKQLQTSERFDHVMIVSFTPDIKKIQDDIAGSLGLEFRDVNESDRPKKLWSRLTNGEKILVILDDVVGNLNFDDIGLPNSDNHKGCKVLVTSCQSRVFKEMGCGKIISLKILSAEDAWAMFQVHTDLKNSSDEIFFDKGREIAIECKGLPVAIAAIASTLKKNNDVKEWDAVLKSFRNPVSIGGIDGTLFDTYKCLKISYDFMKDDKARELFLLCLAFLKDEEISIEILTRLGIGVNLFGDGYDKYKDARHQALETKNKLLGSSLLLETKKGYLKMHHFFREVVQWIENEEIRTVNLSNKHHKPLVERDKNIKYLLCEGNLKDLFSIDFSESKLQILIVNINMWGIVDIPISFFGSISRLRVLNLLNKSINLERPTLSLPQSIKSLTNIRSILVESVYLGDISILGCLHSLETLDLVHCHIEELPHEIENLKKLRLLNLEHCEIRSNNPFEVIQNCTSLEELYFCNSFNNFVQEITLPKLERYRLTDGFSMTNDTLSKCVSFQKDYFSEGTIKHVMETIELLRLERIKKAWRNLMPDMVPIKNGMNDLVRLHFRDDPELQFLIDTKRIDSPVPNVVFSELVVLHLEEMGNLEELCNGPISCDSMNKLKELSVESCGHLRSLFKGDLNLCSLKNMKLKACSTLVSVFDLSTSQTLRQLESLEIIDCEKLENIIKYGDNDNKSCNSMFPSLKMVNIQSCPQLQFILPFISAGDHLLLEVIIINCCHKLKYIFGQHQDVKLASLREMAIGDSPNFIDIFPESNHSSLSSNKGSSNSISKPQTQFEPIKSNISSCSKSTKILLVPEDQRKNCSFNSVESISYSLSIWEHAQRLSRSISNMAVNIKVVKLVNVSKIKSVFILSIAPKVSWESLIVKNCDELKHIIVGIGDNSGGGEIFPKLKELCIESCKKMEYIFGHIGQSNEVTHLHLPALECLQLCSLPSLIGKCTKSYRTTFPPLAVLELIDCPQADDIKSIGDFFLDCSISRYHDSTTFKEFGGNLEHFRSLERLKVHNSKVESIFCFNEVSEPQMNLALHNIELHNLPMMTSLFVDSKNSFALKNLKRIKIVRCEKLEIIFSTSISRCLPQLLDLRIEECKELKYIIKDDFEKQRMSKNLSSNTGFPKLQALAVVNCNKLKCVFPISICKELLQLKVLLIREAYKLEAVFESEGDDQKVKIPNLKVLVFVNLPNLSQTQGIQFQDVKTCFIQNCQKLSLSSSPPIRIDDNFNTYDIGYETRENMLSLFQQLREEATDKDFAAWINQIVAAEHELISSKGLMSGKSTNQHNLMKQQHPIREIYSNIFKPFRGNNLEGSMSTTSVTRNVQPLQLVAPKQKLKGERS